MKDKSDIRNALGNLLKGWRDLERQNKSLGRIRIMVDEIMLFEFSVNAYLVCPPFDDYTDCNDDYQDL